MGKEYEVEKILQKRVEFGKVSYKIKWKNYPVDEATWEPQKNLTSCPDMIYQFNRASGELPDAILKPKEIEIQKNQHRIRRKEEKRLRRLQDERAQIQKQMAESIQDQKRTSKEEEKKKESKQRVEEVVPKRRENQQTKVLQMFIDKRGQYHFKVTKGGKEQIVSRSYLVMADIMAIIRFYQENMNIVSK